MTRNLANCDKVLSNIVEYGALFVTKFCQMACFFCDRDLSNKKYLCVL